MNDPNEPRPDDPRPADPRINDPTGPGEHKPGEHEPGEHEPGGHERPVRAGQLDPGAIRPGGHDPKSTEGAKGGKTAAMAGGPSKQSVSVGPMPGDAATSDLILVMLIGGPRNGWQERIPTGTTQVSVDVDGTAHTYMKDANLPDDFADRMPTPHHPTQYFGYNGPDQDYIDALALEYPPTVPDVPESQSGERGPDVPHGPQHGLDVERGPEHGPAFGGATESGIRPFQGMGSRPGVGGPYDQGAKPGKSITSGDFPR